MLHSNRHSTAGRIFLLSFKHYTDISNRLWILQNTVLWLKGSFLMPCIYTNRQQWRNQFSRLLVTRNTLHRRHGSWNKPAAFLKGLCLLIYYWDCPLSSFLKSAVIAIKDGSAEINDCVSSWDLRKLMQPLHKMSFFFLCYKHTEYSTLPLYSIASK